MTGNEIALAISLIGPSIKAAQQGIGLVRSWIEESFQKGEITVEQQLELMTKLEEYRSVADSGNYPEHWKPQP